MSLCKECKETWHKLRHWIPESWIHCHHEEEKEYPFDGKDVTIKDGSPCGQDMGFHKWGGDKTVFKAEKFTDKRYKLTANGYGAKGNYGNGAVFVNEEYLVDVTVEKKKCWCEIYYPFRVRMKTSVPHDRETGSFIPKYCPICGRKL